MLISERMKNLHPYIPGEQPKDRDYIKLNANENPYPPAGEVISAVTDFIRENPMGLAVYPDPDSSALRAAIADMLNRTGGILCRAVTDGDYVVPSECDRIPFEVTPDMIYAGNGSDEVLSFLFYAFFGSGDRFVMPEFTYSFYPVYAGFYNIPYDSVPLKSDWSLDTEEMVRHAAANHAGIIFANPNAPTGLALSRGEVRKMIENAPSDRIFVVDEAYADFGGESCIPLLSEFKNLVVVRTFSKSLCSAGMRLGYIVSSPEIVSEVTTVKNSVNHFPVDAIAQTAGRAACGNPAYYAECAKKVVSERGAFSGFLERKGFFVIPSKTNFLFAGKDGFSGEYIYRKIKEQGILVRHFGTPGIEDFVRITIGTPQQMERLREAVEHL